MLKFTILLVNWFVGEIYAASSGCSTTGLTDSDRQVITNLHNNFRSSLAKGQEPTASGGNAPTAKNMYKIVLGVEKGLYFENSWIKVYWDMGYIKTHEKLGYISPMGAFEP
uniref:SCP domain-containing protein n=1 Tax=Acrobeloides nanus TaxID=290746 RepID=A0A914DG63_9BILA